MSRTSFYLIQNKTTFSNVDVSRDGSLQTLILITLLVVSHWAIARPMTFVEMKICNLCLPRERHRGAVELAQAALDASGLDAEIELRDWNLAQQQMMQAQSMD